MSIDIRKIFPGYQQLNPSGSASTLVLGSPRAGGFLAGDAFTISDGTNSETFSYTQTPTTSTEFSNMDGLVVAIEAVFTNVTTSVDANGALTITFPISGQPANPTGTQGNSGLKSSYELFDHQGTPTVVIPDNNTVEFSVDGNPISYKYQANPAAVRASATGHGGLDYAAAQDGLAGNGVNISLVEQTSTTPGTKAVTVAESDSTAQGGPVDTVTLTLDTNAAQAGVPGSTGNLDFLEADGLRIDIATAGLANGTAAAGDEYQVVINYGLGSGDSATEVAGAGNGQILTINLDTTTEGNATSEQIANLISGAGLTHFSATGQASSAASASGAGLTFTAVNSGAAGNNITVTITDNTGVGSDVINVNGNDISVELDQAASTSFTSDIENLINGDATASTLITVSGGDTSTAGSTLTQTSLLGGSDTTTLSAGNWPDATSQNLTGGVADVAQVPAVTEVTVADYTLQDIIDAVTAATVTLIQVPTVVTGQAASDAVNATTPNLVTAGGEVPGWSNAAELAAKIVAANSSVLQIKLGTTSTLESINPAAITFAFTYQGVNVDNTYPVFANSIIAGYGGGDYWGAIVGTQGTADTGASNTFQYNEKYIAIPLGDLLLGSNSTNPNHLTADESNQITGDYRKVAYHIIRKIHEYIDGLEHITGLTISAGGTGYAVTDTVDVPGIGTGTIAIDASGAITDIFLNGSSMLSVNNPGILGKGFTTAPVITVNSSTGVGAGISADISDLDPGKMDITKGSLSENTATNELTRPYTISFTFNEQGLELSNED